MLPAKPADSFCSSSSVEGAPDEMSTVTFGCSSSKSLASPSRIVSAWSAWPVHQVMVVLASGSNVAAPCALPPEQAVTDREAMTAVAAVRAARRFRGERWGDNVVLLESVAGVRTGRRSG